VISGQEEHKFTNLITSISGDKPDASELGTGGGFVDEAQMNKAQLTDAVQGTAYMEAEDNEEKKILLKQAEKRARDVAMEQAAEIKAAGMAKAAVSKRQAALQHIDVDQAKRDDDAKAEKASEQAVGKGWLSPKLGGELVMQQKKKVADDQAQLRADRSNEKDLKLRDRMTRTEYKHHQDKKAEGILGEATAQHENAKEMAMKFVKAEMERRQKSAFQERLKDEENKKNMVAQAEVAAKQNAMHENKEKMKESSAKGKAQEIGHKQKDKEKEAKIIAASHKEKVTNCKVGPWQSWTACSRACSGGIAERSRSVMLPTENGGADCPALSQSKPCNTQPCLSVSFGKGYCSKALTECTKARALARGCGATRSFGNANKLSKTYVNDAKKTEAQIDKIDPPGAQSERSREPAVSNTPEVDEHPADRPGDQNPDLPVETDETPAKQSTVSKSPHMVNMGNFASDKPKAGTTKHVVHTRAKPKAHKVDMGFSDNDMDAAVATEIQKIQEAGKNSKASVQFEFPRDEAPATVRAAVGSYLVGGNHKADVLPDVELIQVDDSPLGIIDKTAQKTAAIDQSGNSVMADMAQAKCAEYKDRVAMYCGQMVDCVTQSMDQQDRDYSKRMSDAVDKEAAAQGIPQSAVTTDDRAFQSPEDDERDAADEKRSAEIRAMVPSDRSENPSTAATIPQGYRMPDDIPKPPVETEVTPTLDPSRMEGPRGIQKGLFPGTFNTLSSMPEPKKGKQTYPEYERLKKSPSLGH